MIWDTLLSRMLLYLSHEFFSQKVIYLFSTRSPTYTLKTSDQQIFSTTYEKFS